MDKQEEKVRFLRPELRNYINNSIFYGNNYKNQRNRSSGLGSLGPTNNQ